MGELLQIQLLVMELWELRMLELLQTRLLVMELRAVRTVEVRL
jgi:hypothetical protein